MSYWTWDSSLSVGINIIDEQHQRIVSYLNELDIAYLEGDNDKVTHILMGLVDYTISHFAFEENLMAQSGYPLSDPHKMVHKVFVAHINNYKKQHESGRDITKKLMSELQIWLTNHIKKEDRDYVPYVNKFLNKKKGWINKTIGLFFR